MFDAIVPAGGSARRLDGADKPGLVVSGRTLLDHVVTALERAEQVVVVGPQRHTGREVPEVREVRWCREEPPGGGPVAAIAAALDLVSAPITLVLAADLPWIAGAVDPLLSALGTHDAAVLTREGRRNFLAAAWRTEALRSAVAGVGDPSGAAARALYADRDVVDVPDTGGWGRDCDTWADLAAAQAH